jgi:hypothetical protein
MFEVSQKAMTPLRDIYDFPITEFFFYSSFLVEQNQKQLNEMKKISNRTR